MWQAKRQHGYETSDAVSGMAGDSLTSERNMGFSEQYSGKDIDEGKRLNFSLNPSLPHPNTRE